MTTITGFLLARIAEDEAVARAASPGPWKWEGDYPKGHCPHDAEWTDHGPDLMSSVATNDKFDYGFHPVITSSGYDASSLTIKDADADFIAANNPARVLAECAAKRAIIEQHATQEVASLDRATWGQAFLVCRVCAVVSRQIVAPCPTLRALAAVYADHPDYQPEWAL